MFRGQEHAIPTLNSVGGAPLRPPEMPLHGPDLLLTPPMSQFLPQWPFRPHSFWPPGIDELFPGYYKPKRPDRIPSIWQHPSLPAVRELPQRPAPTTLRQQLQSAHSGLMSATSPWLCSKRGKLKLLLTEIWQMWQQSHSSSCSWESWCQEGKLTHLSFNMVFVINTKVQ